MGGGSLGSGVKAKEAMDLTLIREANRNRVGTSSQEAYKYMISSDRTHSFYQICHRGDTRSESYSEYQSNLLLKNFLLMPKTIKWKIRSICDRYMNNV